MATVRFEVSKFGGPYIKAVFEPDRISWEKPEWEAIKKQIDEWFTLQEKSKT